MEKLIRWVEIPALDIQRAVFFYNAVFEIDLQILDYGNEKMACFPGSEGAISYAPDFKPSKDGALVSFHVNDMEKAIQKIENLKGKIVTPKTKIEAEGMGYFALFIDSEGNKAGLHSDK